MATNFSPVLRVLCFKPFPSIVMFGMKGFYISASGAIQGHHGPRVSVCHRTIYYLMILSAVTKTRFYVSIISSTVFGENPRYCYSLGGVVQKL